MEKNSQIFFNYIKSQGFKPDEYNKILELFQSANGSISQYLTEYNQYLLSSSVIYYELDRLGIDGAYGYLDNFGEILVPKCLGNDRRFLYNGIKRPTIKHSYGTPTTPEFDAIIGRMTLSTNKEMIRQLTSTLLNNNNHQQFLGFCVDNDKIENIEHLISSYQNLIQEINNAFGNKIYTFEHDTIRAKGKEICLIKRSKK